MSLLACDVSVSINNKTLLKHVDFVCHTNEMIAIIGENGAGKSTLLQTLAGNTNFTGSVTMNGADIRKLSTKTQAQHRAFLPQNTDTSFNFSVKDIIQMPMTLSRLSPAQQKELTAYCLEITNSEAFSERAYLPLSGGEKQRIQLSRVIAQLFSHPEPYPHFLLLDEPISALDLRHQYTILQRLKTLCQQKKPFPVSVILVLHDINLAALFCDKILLLHQTQAIAYGTPEKVLTKAQIEEVFRIKAHLHVHPDTQTPFFIPKI